MQTANNVLKWSAVITGFTGFMILGAVFATWLLIQMLVLLAGVSA